MDLRGVIARRAAAAAAESTAPIHVSRSGDVTSGHAGRIGRVTYDSSNREWFPVHHSGVTPGSWKRQSDAVMALSRYHSRGEFPGWEHFGTGEWQLPTSEVHKLRQHDEVNSGKAPHLLDDVREHGITEPLEISLHDDERGAVLRSGSHRVNAAHTLGIDSVPVRVIDMRQRRR